MSKYIRTKYNKILKVLDMEFACGVKVYHTESGYISERLVLKEADTIEDLVDEYVWDKSIIRFRDKTHFSYENDDFIFELDESILKEGIYGAVWIVDDNGAPILKSVSRMNEKGDLELI